MKRKFSLLFAVLTTIFTVGANTSVWNLTELNQTPEYKVISQTNSVLGLIYKGANYNGSKSDVFAYYCTPGMLKGDPSLDKNLPAVVCVHGGGGKAYQQWVKMWAEKGFAAISMDLRGFGPDSTRLPNGFVEENFKTPYFVCHDDRTKDWFYQAVASVVSAHSLLLSFKEIDPQRTAITGVSWGGIITTLVAGLDNRFKVASPVYGCGFLLQSGSMAHQIRRQPAFAQERWKQHYDPSNYLQSIRIPVLFVNGTNDNHFFLDQFTETVNRVQNAEMSLRIGLKHGHGPAWQVPEVQNFMAYHLGSTNSVVPPKITDIKNQKRILTASVTDNVSKGFLIYTESPELNAKALWSEKEIAISKGRVEVEVPKEAKFWFISVEDNNTNRISTKLYTN